MDAAYIQAVAMAWLPLKGALEAANFSSGEAKKVRFLWTTPVGCDFREAKNWARTFYQESRKANLRCIARNVCEEIKSGLTSFCGTVICNECSFFYGMALQDLKLLNEAVQEAGNYQRLADKFEKTNGLNGHFAEFESDGEWREVFAEQATSQSTATEELRITAVVVDALEKKEEERRMEEQAKKKSGGPVGPCEIFLNGKSVWSQICHWSVARKQARYEKFQARELDMVDLYEGGKLVPPEKWNKMPVLKRPKVIVAKTKKEKVPKETATTVGEEISVPISLGKFYRKFVLESIVRGDEVSAEDSASGRFFYQEIPEQEMWELLRKGAGL